MRYSGTENKLRVLVEAQDRKLCDEYSAELTSLVEKEIGV